MLRKAIRVRGIVRVFDIAYFGCGLLNDNNNYRDAERVKIWREIFEGFLEGYEEMTPLCEDERKAIPVLFVFIEVLFTAYNLKMGKSKDTEECLEMTNWLHENIYEMV
jgi:Ser/Thr protein kinase RdoA (MazF antagonist)